MVKGTTQKLCFNGGSLLTALEAQNISPENFFGRHIPTIKEIKQQIELEAWFVMHPLQIKVVGAQQWKLVYPIGSEYA